MTSLLLACVFLQFSPPGSPAAQVEQMLLTQVRVAAEAMENDPERALEVLDAVVDNPLAKQFAPQSLLIRTYREQAQYLRGESLLRLGRFQQVVDEMTALLGDKKTQLHRRTAGLIGSLASPVPFQPLPSLGLAPRGEQLQRWDWMQPLSLRSRAWKELGQDAKAQADQQELRALTKQLRPEFEEFEDGEAFDEGDWDGTAGLVTGLAHLSGKVKGWVLAVVLFLGMIPAFAWMGARQRRDARGTWGRLILVSVALSLLQTLPVVLAVLLSLRWPELNNTPALITATVLVYLVNLFRHRAYLQALVWTNSNEPPPLLDDDRVLDRVEELSERMGVRTPVVRCVYSTSAQQSNEALISGLVAPTMLLHDGILNRLDAEERDAVIAHELGHLANRTFEWWLVVGAVCSVAVVLAASFFHPLVVFALGAALLTGVSLVLTRWLELDCDRRAARAIGHRRTASALFKIHADQPFRGSPWLEFLIGATSTHPSRDERLAAIHRDAPAGDPPEVHWDAGQVTRRQWASRFFVGLGVLLIVECLVWSRAWPDSRLPALPLFLIPATPLALLWLGSRRTLRRHGRLQHKRSSWWGWVRWTPTLLLVGWIGLNWLGVLEGVVSPLIDLAIIFGLLLLSVGTGLFFRATDRARALNQKIAVAIGSDNYPAALDICEANLSVVAGSPELRHNHGLILAVLGKRDEGIAILEALRADEPAFKLTWLVLVSIYCDEQRYEEALAIARQVSKDMPDDSLGPQAEAWTLMKLNRLDEAEELARKALKMEATAGSAFLVLGGVALRRGDLAQARQELAHAERVAPGTVGGAILKAEIALATNDPDAPALVKQATKAARTTPLAFADREVERLRETLNRRNTEPGT